MKHYGLLKDRVSVNSDADEVQEHCRLGQALSLDTFAHHLSPFCDGHHFQVALLSSPESCPNRPAESRLPGRGPPSEEGVEPAEEQRDKGPHSASTGSVLVARLLIGFGPLWS